jgi:hypothetical protein
VLCLVTFPAGEAFGSGIVLPNDAYLVVVGQENKVNVREFLWRHPRHRLSHSLRAAERCSLVEDNDVLLGLNAVKLSKRLFEHEVKRFGDRCINASGLSHTDHMDTVPVPRIII